MNSKEMSEQAGASKSSWKHGAYYLGRFVAYFYRLNALRLAKVIFGAVHSPAILRRRFYGRTLVLDVSRANPQKLLWLLGHRFVKERSLVEHCVRPGMTVVDVGANIGYYALMLSSLVGDKGRILCIEPDTTNLLELNANIAENKLEEMITVLQVAAGDRDGTTRFEPGLNSHVVPDGSCEVVVKRIDSLETTRVDFIKIDVEGYEGAVLEGAAKTIEEFRPTLFLELHPDLLTRHTHGEILQLLQRSYSDITAYQIERATFLRRFLQNYGLADPFSQAGDIRQMVRGYEAGYFKEPCWLVARGQPKV